jgi:hypothetical protein
MLGALGLVGCEVAPPQLAEAEDLEPSSIEQVESELLSAQDSSVSPFPGATIWVRQGVGPYDDERLTAVTQDRQGNTLAAGIFTGTIDFGAGRVWNGDPGDWFVVVVKYAPDARVLWNLPLRVSTLGAPPGVPFAEVGAIAADRQGNILLAGKTSSTFELGTVNLPPGHFLLKLSPSGTLLWARAMSSTGDARLTSLATGEHGSIALGGWVSGTLTIGNMTLSSPSASKPFLGKLTSEGTVSWARLLPSSEPGVGLGVAVDSEQFLYLCGGLGADPFVSRFSPSGHPVWTRRLAHAGGTARGVATHGNRVVVTGSFSGTFTFRGAPFTASGQDAFLVAYTREGEQRWARNFGVSGVAVGMDPNDGVLVTGTYEDLDDLGMGILRGSETGSNMFVARFNRVGGEPLWTRGIGDLGGSASVSPTSLAVTREGEGAIVGHFSNGPSNFGGAVLFPTGYFLHQDPFILRVAP